MATVLEEWGMRCPVCKDDTRLEITVTTSVLLTPDGTDIFEVQDGSHEWEPSSPCACRSCDWGGTVAEATVAKEPQED